jgi:hypothetical protein
MGNDDESLEAIGVFALQQGQTEVHDLMIYYTVFHPDGKITRLGD